MPTATDTPTRVVGDAGLTAQFVSRTDDGRHATLRLADGRAVRVPYELLERRDADTFYLPMTAADLEGHSVAAGRADADHVVVDVVEEQVRVDKRRVERGKVRIVKTVREEQQQFDQELMRETVEVERVPREEFVHAMAEPRTEGDELVIPVYEEVLVVEKRLMLKEEIHVHRRREVRTETTPVTVRKEEVNVERVAADPA